MRVLRILAVAVLCSACGAEGPANGPPANVIKASGDGAQGVVGQQLLSPPVVRVTDDQDRPVPGANVTFAVASGGGSATGTSVVTDDEGEAQVGSWTLGTTAGSNTMTATVGTLPAVTFTVTGVAGAATTIEKASTDGVELHLGSSASPRPSVRLKDTYGNLVSGATVTFAVASGGGNATGTSQSTDATGIATVGTWTLGANAGTNTMTASSGSLASVTFTMSAVDKCAQAPPEYVLGSTTTGSLASGDCLLTSGHYSDKFTIVRNSQVAFRLDQKSTTVDSRLMLYSQPDLRLVQTGPTGFDASMSFIAGVGSFIVGTSTVNAGATGSYSLESTVISESVENCVTTVLVNVAATSQSLQSTDCNDAQASGTYYYDRYVIFVQTGQMYCVTHSTSAFNPYVEVQTLAGVPTNAAQSTGSGTRTAKTSFTASATEHRLVLASSVSFTQSGAYGLTFNPGTCPP